MSGVLPPDVEYAASRASTQAIAKYFEAGGSADDTSAEGQPLLHLVQSAMVGHRHAPAVRAVLDGGPRNVDAHWLAVHPLLDDYDDEEFWYQKRDHRKAMTLVADVRSAGGTWALGESVFTD